MYTDPDTGEDEVQVKAVDALLERQFGSGHVNQPDGVYPPSHIRLKGTNYDGLSGKRWQLVECLWGRKSMPVTDVIEAVWGADADPTGGALTSLCKHLNAWFRKESCPLAVQTRKGHVRLVHTGAAGKK